MIRYVFALLMIGALFSVSRGDDEGDRARRVRVALALSCGCAEHCEKPTTKTDRVNPWLITVPVEIAPAPKVADEEKKKAPPAPPKVMPLPDDGAVLPTVRVKKYDFVIEVYGWKANGERVGYYLPRNSTDAEILAKARELEKWLKEVQPQAAGPFSTRTTPATGAGPASTPSNRFYPTAGTLIRVPGAVFGGSTNC